MTIDISIIAGVEKMTVGERIESEMKKRGISQNRLAKLAQISQSGLSSIIHGAVSPKEATLQNIANALGCNASELLGGSAFISIERNAVPIIGEIACGEQITAQQNIDGYTDVPSGVHADFALKCKGDSMTPTFNDGDIVLIRKQPEVENGQIAAVGINGEATLKHFYNQNGMILLTADNPRFPPIHVAPDDDIVVYGLAIGYTRIFN